MPLDVVACSVLAVSAEVFSASTVTSPLPSAVSVLSLTAASDEVRIVLVAMVTVAATAVASLLPKMSVPVADAELSAMAETVASSIA